MKKLFDGAIALALFAATALSGTVAFSQSLPTVQAVHATDQIQVLPYGSPSSPSQFATVSQILTAGGSGNGDGLSGAPFRLLDFKNVDGTNIAASATTNVFGFSITPGTSEYLVTEAANSSTKTDVAIYEVILPSSYVAGSNITVTANCNYVLGGGTVGTHTLAAAAYLTANAGTQGSTLIATSAQTVPAAAGTVNFTITGATLSAGSRLLLSFTEVIQDTGGSNITARLNSVSLN